MLARARERRPVPASPDEAARLFPRLRTLSGALGAAGPLRDHCDWPLGLKGHGTRRARLCCLGPRVAVHLPASPRASSKSQSASVSVRQAVPRERGLPATCLGK